MPLPPDDLGEDFAQDEFEFIDPHQAGDAAIEKLANGTASQKSNAGDEPIKQDSYEEFVMKRVAAYVAQSHDYIESTDLAKRVTKWHESIGPKLERLRNERSSTFMSTDQGFCLIFRTTIGKRRYNSPTLSKDKKRRKSLGYSSRR